MAVQAEGEIWAVVPVKRLDQAKSRLDPVLGDERAGFAFAMARQVVEALAASGRFAGVLVVTTDAAVADMARNLGAIVEDGGDDGLNAAMAAGIAAARLRGAAHVALVPGDLALLDTAAIGRVLDAYRGVAPLITPCSRGDGTNMIVMPMKAALKPAFGSGSFAAHRLQAGEADIRVDAAIGLDIDMPIDFAIAAGQTAEMSKPLADMFAAHEAAALLAIDPAELQASAAALRDQGHGDIVTYSPKVFLPLTMLCRDVCHYCAFAKTPRKLKSPYMSVDEVVAIAEQGAAMGCREALFTLGEKPELRYTAAREWLDANGFASTLDYVAHVAKAVRDRTGLLPHINAGCMDETELAALRPVSASMGLMLETIADRLSEPGGPHHGSPDKVPAVRLAAIEAAGRQAVPFTSGILIGIGETRAERIEAIAALRDLHRKHGHLQEIIIQNFLPKPGTKMADAPAADADELLWTIAVARLMFGPDMSIQAPPNLAPTELPKLITAGINDWGGVSPLTPDHVNPEAPWPEIDRLRTATAAAGKVLAERLTIYPAYARNPERWLDPAMRPRALEHSDGSGRGRESGWRAGRSAEMAPIARGGGRGGRTAALVDAALNGQAGDFAISDIAALFDARGTDYHLVCEAADEMRARTVGDVATYVVNRNINYTNICGYRCNFCAFSKGNRKAAGNEAAYLLDIAEISARVAEARDRGGTEVCLQGGIHPSFTGETYLNIVKAVKAVDPAMHVHAFSPLEISHGAATLNMALPDYLALLRDAGLGSLPGTAAEILHDPVRQILCPDKIDTGQWLEVIETAHQQGIRTTATIMFGHVDDYCDWAIHLAALRDLQKRTGGFTEFVPLAFVAHEAPIYRRGGARPGPTPREAVLMHAVSRLVLGFDNIQASWVKMGREGMRAALKAGANDLGGTLMNESITRAAGATHGQEMTATDMRSLAAGLGRTPVRRTTLYGVADVQGECVAAE
ncbi:FO synthase subunit 1 /FO synthase subunit 2 [Sphingomonas laterariae]|uniref:3-phospho-D-glycerate guanylyltransferase n=1 Tax=Edaphosphingomonas laterariae TaxID=861865 RepID=A0A239BDZ5_9SPHN|nr:5-amino-6-(D-ribitylamino)uracil--L-tyrosine 4-hydroxyphenyl transferase CofH [Sphingomonas laterariae]SNS06036.1 FO synthase subunit 1 /FO synthase subunit 2 [Sphingomonas laterariae]